MLLLVQEAEETLLQDQLTEESSQIKWFLEPNMADVTDVFEIELHEDGLCEEEDDDIIDIIDDVSWNL